MKHLLTAALITAGTMATAQGGCMPREMMVETLKNTYYERMVFGGLTKQQTPELVELWLHDSGSWTITISHPSGPMCVVSHGVSGDLFVEKGIRL